MKTFGCETGKHWLCPMPDPDSCECNCHKEEVTSDERTMHQMQQVVGTAEGEYQSEDVRTVRIEALAKVAYEVYWSTVYPYYAVPDMDSSSSTTWYSVVEAVLDADARAEFNTVVTEELECLIPRKSQEKSHDVRSRQQRTHRVVRIPRS